MCAAPPFGEGVGIVRLKSRNAHVADLLPPFGIVAEVGKDLNAHLRELFSQIHAKLADYGFILRYLEGRDDITGYAYEPWHLRYVGSPTVAHEIMDQGLTLEDYLTGSTQTPTTNP